jgi:hypothetical protein
MSSHVCKTDDCTECCTHDELDHFTCLYCGEELDPFIEVECE